MRANALGRQADDVLRQHADEHPKRLVAHQSCTGASSRRWRSRPDAAPPRARPGRSAPRLRASGSACTGRPACSRRAWRAPHRVRADLQAAELHRTERARRADDRGRPRRSCGSALERNEHLGRPSTHRSARSRSGHRRCIARNGHLLLPGRPDPDLRSDTISSRHGSGTVLAAAQRSSSASTRRSASGSSAARTALVTAS